MSKIFEIVSKNNKEFKVEVLGGDEKKSMKNLFAQEKEFIVSFSEVSKMLVKRAFWMECM